MRRHTGQRLRRSRQAFAVAAAASITLLTFAGPAAAHNVLISSDPAANTVLAKAPASITLVFDQDVQNIYADMAVTIGSQAPVAFTPTVNGHDVTADLTDEHLTIPAQPGLTPWRIGYRIVSADGHPVTGLVNFSVGVASARSSTSAASSAAASSGGVPWFFIVGAVVLLLVVAAAVPLWMRRRGSTR